MCYKNNDDRQAYVLELADQKLKAISKEDLRELLSEVQDSDGSIEIRNLPDISEVTGMNHIELLKLHQLCPFSQYFGQSSFKLNMSSCTFEQAQEHAIQMIKESTAHVT